MSYCTRDCMRSSLSKQSKSISFALLGKGYEVSNFKPPGVSSSLEKLHSHEESQDTNSMDTAHLHWTLKEWRECFTEVSSSTCCSDQMKTSGFDGQSEKEKIHSTHFHSEPIWRITSLMGMLFYAWNVFSHHIGGTMNCNRYFRKCHVFICKSVLETRVYLSKR